MLRRNKETRIAPRTSEGLTRWGGWSDPFRWFNEMDRRFDDFRREIERTWSGWPGAGSSLDWFDGAREPAIDLRDDGAEFLVTAELPGVSKEDLEIQAAPDNLEIRADAQRQREEKDEDCFQREWNYVSFYRSLPLPAAIVPDKVVATLNNGVLEIRLPKQEPTPAPKAVKVTVQ